MDIRGSFTFAVRNWSTSGQNNPSRFPHFLKYNDQNGDLSAEGKRLFISFTVCQLGANNVTTDFLNQTSKTYDDHADGYEEGREDVSDIRRKRRRKSGEDFLCWLATI